MGTNHISGTIDHLGRCQLSLPVSVINSWWSSDNCWSHSPRDLYSAARPSRRNGSITTWCDTKYLACAEPLHRVHLSVAAVTLVLFYSHLHSWHSNRQQLFIVHGCLWVGLHIHLVLWTQWHSVLKTGWKRSWPWSVVMLLCCWVKCGITCSNVPCHLHDAPGHGQLYGLHVHHYQTITTNTWLSQTKITN